MLQANQDSWLKAKAGARIPVKTINKSTHTNIFIYSIFLFRKKLELCRTAMLYVVCCFLLEEIHFMEHFPLALCTIERKSIQRKVASTSLSCFEAHAGLFRLLMKGIFDDYVLRPFGKKFTFELVTRVRTRDSTVPTKILCCEK